ncbi:ABC transporter substrate-binding protein [Rhizobium sp. SEMIA 4085]|uniref:Sugar ABC transporter substrate-binding protein n=1 Tax=Rhizobium gallicum bv. gallicum R602sp TaxID=1041138 RepID=A0A0B4X5S2_9HYPH|nr:MULTISPECIES: ABC transporter substrate-binding protein [Rhizobium]AJD42481.1 sugar ABC transporter substrate-binding protein [Rhizobium gallicum bv. gallicum R602sp]NNH29322.1 ABC transporter substrate-binding protein [Rhizobium sp. SEMIA 4085]
MLKRSLAALAISVGIWTGNAHAETISVFCSPTEFELCTTVANAWKEKTGNEAKINKMPALLDDAIPLYQQLLASKSKDIDVLFLDVIWLGMFKNNLLDLKTLVPQADQDKHFASTLGAAKLDGKLVAMPAYMDVGLMYYRKDLLEKYGKQPPKSWDELAASAKEVQDKERAAGNGEMWGYAWQAKSYEGLTCDAIELIASNGGGTIISDDGKVTIDNPQAAEAIEKAKGWIGSISPEGVLNYDEEASRAIFESGNAVFHRNWPYVWGTTHQKGSAVIDKVGVMPLPVGKEGQKSSGCLGPMYYGVSKFSAKPEVAADFVNFITAPDMQKMRAIEAAYNPSIQALYSDPDVLAKLPFLKDNQQAFADSASRPSGYTGTSYNRVSQAFYRSVHDMLSGGGDIKSGLSALAARLEKLKESR